MAAKLDFIERATRRDANLAALAREFGISRQTAHKWLRRFRLEGHDGLDERTRRPKSSPLSSAEDVVVEIVRMRDSHPSWGADKLVQALARRMSDPPSRSTVTRVLRRLGRARPRRRVLPSYGPTAPAQPLRDEPNDLWSVDFKGWWVARNGERCEPFTVRDAASRFVLAVQLVPSTAGRNVQKILQKLFRTHGVPRAMQFDQGTPWASPRARGLLTRLSVWLRSLGVRLCPSRAGHPEDNGGHERMHRDLAELELSPARSRSAQQRRCDKWRLEFNHLRPHGALGGRTPAEMYVTTAKQMPVERTPHYPEGWMTRRVTRAGRICLQGDMPYVGAALAGRLVGLRHEGGLRWRARFFDIDLGTLELAAAMLPRLAREGRDERQV